MKLWNTLALASIGAALLGCGAGGTNDVNLTGTNSEDPGPKSLPGKIVGGSSTPSSEVGTITALCIQACSHLRAANCELEPAYTAAECPSECSGGSGAVDCDDELVKLYHCVIDTAVECSSVGQPRQEACEGFNTAYEDCLDHGSTDKYPGCVNVPSQDSMCQQYYSPNYRYYQCTSSSSPSPSCIYVYSNAFCCP